MGRGRTADHAGRRSSRCRVVPRRGGRTARQPDTKGQGAVVGGYERAAGGGRARLSRRGGTRRRRARGRRVRRGRPPRRRRTRRGPRPRLRRRGSAGTDRPEAARSAADRPAAGRLVRPRDAGSYLWPYTSRRRSVDGRTLALNVVVLGEPDRVRRALERRSDANWSGAESDAAIGETPWRHASGATRYTYVTDAPGAEGQWVEATYQLAVGSYFTARVHARAYPAPSGDWTALQAHTEYWDWFRLRHTVTGTGPGARFVEEDLRGLPATTDLRREYHGLGGSGNSGWLSVIEIASASAAGLLVVASRRRLHDRALDLALPGALVAIVLGVRAAGVTVADLFVGTNPQVLAGCAIRSSWPGRRWRPLGWRPTTRSTRRGWQRSASVRAWRSTSRSSGSPRCRSASRSTGSPWSSRWRPWRPEPARATGG
ncbi:hypothetical protein ACFQL4_10275 [Halosimplex aquaticum]